MKVLYLIAPQNFRDEEYLIPKGILEEAGHKVVTASLTAEIARGMRGAKVKPDLAIRDANVEDYGLLVVAGGSGSPKLADYPEVLQLLRKFRARGKPLASICLAGYVLARSGVLKGRTATVFPEDFALAAYHQE